MLHRQTVCAAASAPATTVIRPLALPSPLRNSRRAGRATSGACRRERPRPMHHERAYDQQSRDRNLRWDDGSAELRVSGKQKYEVDEVGHEVDGGETDELAQIRRIREPGPASLSGVRGRDRNR